MDQSPYALYAIFMTLTSQTLKLFQVAFLHNIASWNKWHLPLVEFQYNYASLCTAYCITTGNSFCSELYCVYTSNKLHGIRHFRIFIMVDKVDISQVFILKSLCFVSLHDTYIKPSFPFLILLLQLSSIHNYLFLFPFLGISVCFYTIPFSITISEILQSILWF